MLLRCSGRPWQCNNEPTWMTSASCVYKNSIKKTIFTAATVWTACCHLASGTEVSAVMAGYRAASLPWVWDPTLLHSTIMFCFFFLVSIKGIQLSKHFMTKTRIEMWQYAAMIASPTCPNIVTSGFKKTFSVIMWFSRLLNGNQKNQIGYIAVATSTTLNTVYDSNPCSQPGLASWPTM